MGLFRRSRRPPPVRWVRVATVRHQPEAEMLAEILRAEMIPAVVRGRFAGTPEMLAGAPHEILVPEARALEAHALIDPMDAPAAGGE